MRPNESLPTGDTPDRYLPAAGGELSAFFGPDGLLARSLAGFELRPGQASMAAAVAGILRQGGILAAEAETGIGKTLAYLIPAALSGRKIVVSTGTLNLQDQILRKEIPFLQAHIDPELTAICVKGRQNYLCLHRWHQLLSGRQLPLAGDEEAATIGRWLEETETGDRAELAWLPDHSPLWQEICSTANRCLGGHCPESGSCFLNRLRRKAAKARLLIVNHHLFFSDLAIRRYGHAEVLPRYQSVIFDEAHQLENIATRYFGISLSHYQLLELARDIEQLSASELTGKRREKSIQLARALASQTERFISIFPREKGRYPLPAFIEHQPLWTSEAEDLDGSLAALDLQLAELGGEQEIWLGFSRRAQELRQKFLEITAAPDASGHIYWFERREKALSLAASPLDIAADLEASLYREVESVVLTSATLTAAGDFGYLRKQLGLPGDTETLKLPSPFDYRRRTLLYVPEQEFPAPAAPAYPEMACERMLQLLQASQGRALVLFTSTRAMQLAHRYLAGLLPYPVFMQGEAPKQELLTRFQQHVHSVLLAVASFWEGVDVPGEALSCLIIDKLPFEVPSDPVLQARQESIRQEGGNPFLELQVPRAVLILRQGLGRLMRSATDRGVLAILDVRLFTKPYGRQFLSSLPPSPVTRDLAAVAEFFGP